MLMLGKSLVATVGAYIYSGDNKFKIKKSKIRGEVSNGMICSENELGLGSDDDIMILDTNAKVGENLSEHFDIENDSVFHIGLTLIEQMPCLIWSSKRFKMFLKYN